MRRISTLLVIALFGGLLAFSPAGPAPVAAQSDPDAYREDSDINKMFHKLGRGVSNVLLGWVEIPKTVASEWRRTEPFTGTILGVIKGSVWAVARTLSGFYEIISFPLPVPRDYQPLIYPEFVLPSVWGERLPVYRDEFLASSADEMRALDLATSAPTAGEAGMRDTRRVRSY